MLVIQKETKVRTLSPVIRGVKTVEEAEAPDRVYICKSKPAEPKSYPSDQRQVTHERRLRIPTPIRQYTCKRVLVKRSY